jgi:hypothetical protein
MCLGVKEEVVCPQRHLCKGYTARANLLYQSYFFIPPFENALIEDNMLTVCDEFWSNEEVQSLTFK